MIDVMGVGYLVHCTTDLLAKVDRGQEVALVVETVVREDSITLYGFESVDDKNWFEALRSTQGVGPALALAILSALSRSDLFYAISQRDQALLTQVPGVGAKTASRLILELQGRIDALASAGSAMSRDAPGSNSADLRAALSSLGYSPEQIRAVVSAVPSELPLEDMIRFCLRELSS